MVDYLAITDDRGPLSKAFIIGAKDCQMQFAFFRIELGELVRSGGAAGYDLCTEIISGGASGADKLAELYAEESKLHLTVFRPDYESFGKRAPIIRNCEIIDHAQYVIALWDGRSRGTAFTVTECIKKGIPVRVFVL